MIDHPVLPLFGPSDEALPLQRILDDERRRRGEDLRLFASAFAVRVRDVTTRLLAGVPGRRRRTEYRLRHLIFDAPAG